MLVWNEAKKEDEEINVDMELDLRGTPFDTAKKEKKEPINVMVSSIEKDTVNRFSFYTGFTVTTLIKMFLHTLIVLLKPINREHTKLPEDVLYSLLTEVLLNAPQLLLKELETKIAETKEQYKGRM